MSKQVWKEPFDVHFLIKNNDPRGFLIELLRFEDDEIPGCGQLYTFSIMPGHRRGDHYHLKKREWFTCVHGEAITLLTSSAGETRAHRLTPDEPSILYAGAGTAHALVNEQSNPAIIVSYGSTQHDLQDQDTFKKIAYGSFLK